ncbi:MAG: pirin family protein, partial [Myxococcales bacterium]
MLDTFPVRRALPAPLRRMVGPFIFFDHFGPVTIPPSRHGGMDVRPHPHIALATISYLFEGEILHRDSLGSEQLIRPGDVNWMSAGRGIVHSERTRPETLARGFDLHGLQTWVALPQTHEESEPSFEHHPAATLPVVELPGATLRVVVGSAYGQRSPVGVVWPTLYVHARLEAGASLAVDEEHAERAVYVIDGAIGCGEREFTAGQMLVLSPGAHVTVHART